MINIYRFRYISFKFTIKIIKCNLLYFQSNSVRSSLKKNGKVLIVPKTLYSFQVVNIENVVYGGRGGGPHKSIILVNIWAWLYFGSRG